jgi:hypothetical protein
MARYIAFIALFIIITVSQAFCDAVDYGRTHAIIVGALCWKDRDIAPFSAENRKDLKIAEALKARGVPDDHMTVLTDAGATSEAIRTAIEKRAAAAGPGSTLIFYFAGRGVLTASGHTFLAGYDTMNGKEEKTAVDVGYIEAILKRCFKGRRVILLADCSYSGALLSVAQALCRKGIDGICLSSSSSASPAAESWTFSQSLLDGLWGEPLFDHDGDGNISLQEFSDETATAMKYRERQKSGRFFFKAQGPLVISPVRDSAVEAGEGPQGDGGRAGASKKGAGSGNTGNSGNAAREPRFGAPAGPYRIGDYVCARHQNKRLPARIVNFRGGEYTLQFCISSKKFEEKHGKESISEITFITWKPGDRVNVLWKGAPFDGVIVKVEDGFHWITYRGLAPFWNEWVGYERIREVNGQKFRAVFVKDGGEWYPATVLAERDGKSFIHYTGYSYNWDEWVGPDRIRQEQPAR